MGSKQIYLPELASNAPPAELPDITKARSKHHRSSIRWLLGACLAFVLVSPFVSVMVGLHLHGGVFHYVPDRRVPVFRGRTLLVETVLIDADPIARIMTMDWQILGEGTSPCAAQTLEACTDVNIFFDNNLLATDTAEFRTSDRPSVPIFRFNASALAQNDPISNTPTFRTHLALFSPGDRQSSLIYYPFDVYSAEIFIFAQDAVTNETIGISMSKTRGIATGFKTKATSGTDPLIPAGMIDINVELKRGNIIKAFSIVATVSIWMITLILLLVMFTCVFFGFRQRSEVLCIPVATLFAFTQLRGSMPGAPEGFGDVLDFVGLLPCLALLSLSAAITLGAFIFSDPTEKARMLSWDLLFEAFPRLARSRTEENVEMQNQEDMRKDPSSL